MAEPRFPVIGATRGEMRGFVASLGEAGYRADQVLEWVYVHGAESFQAMTNLSKCLRAKLEACAVLFTSAAQEVQMSLDGTEKRLIELADGEAVETVTIPAGDRRTVCLSTQVGCPVGCAFCASGLGGLVRSLTAGEIVEQALHARRCFEPPEVSMNLVVMGIGEPLANFDAVVRALTIFTASWGLAMSGRRITVSTVGRPRRMRQLAETGLGVNLAVSLHAPDDATRRRLVPGARPVGQVVKAARDYLEATGREVTVEYVLVQDVNDSPAAAKALADVLGDLDVLVNLIPLNPVPGLPWREPSLARVDAFADELRRRGVRAEVRRQRGADIEAACGQLRRRGEDADGAGRGR
ncbi:MAG: 23S rRNA (adenine(2503)-C(2))-methyltransferase RlmN [bacterium]